MSSFEVKARRIDKVEDHPDADRLSICSILGYRAITAKVPEFRYAEADIPSPATEEDLRALAETRPELVGWKHRYSAGDLIIYVPEAAVVPERLLKFFGYWNVEKDAGMLAGKQGNRVKIVRLRGVYSQGLVWPLGRGVGFDIKESWFLGGDDNWLDIFDGGDRDIQVHEGDDVAGIYGITKYEPPIPSSMNGDAAGIAEFAYNYDFDSIQRWPDFFTPGELVVVTEKLHGTFTRISYRRNVSDDRLFGPNKNIAVASKGLGAKGIVFIDTEKNRAGNVYVKAAIENDLIAKIEEFADQYALDSVDFFGETFGPGIQKFHYGLAKQSFRLFDIRCNYEFCGHNPLILHTEVLGIVRVPVLYFGPYDVQVIEKLRDAPTEFEGSKNIREGVVIMAEGEQAHREHGGDRMRPILKAVSPAYLLKEDEDAVQ